MAHTLGQLRSYGNLTGTAGVDLIYFSGPTAITPVKTGWHTGYHPRLVNPLVYAEGTYPVDTAGYSAMPLDGPPELTYTLVLVAPASDSDDEGFHYLRTQFEAIYDFVMGSYTVDDVSGATGQRGWLVARDERLGDDTLYKAKVRVIIPPEYDLVPGMPHELHLSMTFGMLSTWTAYTEVDTRIDTFIRANADTWGTASDGHVWDSLGYGSLAAISANAGTLTVDSTSNTDTLLLGPALATDDREVSVRWAITDDSTDDLLALATVFLKSDDDNNIFAQLNVRLNGDINLYLNDGITFDSQADTWGGAVVGDHIWVRTRAVGHTYSWRVWLDGTTEPSTWTGSYTTAVTVSSRRVGLSGVPRAIGDTVAFDHFSATTL